MYWMSVADRIREARTEADLTQRDLAKALGVTHGAIALWETGQRDPSVTTVCKIAELTFKEPAWLLFDEIHGKYQPHQVLPEETELLDTYRRMSKRQRENLLKLMRISFGVRVEIEGNRQGVHS
jgi:transcriptional regulator with XRE-family HTH domain